MQRWSGQMAPTANADSANIGAATATRRGFLAAGIGALTFSPSEAFPATPTVQTLRFSDHEPLGGMRTRFLNDVLFPAIERASSGRLKIEARWNSEVASSADALLAVQEGRLADMATVVPEYYANDLPLHQALKSFPTGPSGRRQVEFFRNLYPLVPELPSELRQQKLVNLFFGTGYPVAFFSVRPLPSLDSLSGSRWRTASFWHRDFLSNAGAKPVSMPWGKQVFEALQVGTLDGVMVNADSGFMLNIHEVAPHVLISKDLWLGHVYLLTINADVWSGLVERDRQAVLRAAGAAYARLGTFMDVSFDEQVGLLKRGGATIRVLRRGEVEQWATVTRYREVQSAWEAQQAAKGVVGAAPVIARIGGAMTRSRVSGG